MQQIEESPKSTKGKQKENSKNIDIRTIKQMEQNSETRLSKGPFK